MDAALKAQLLASMNAGRLVIICGAGLSRAAPTELPLARAVAESCYDAYTLKADPDLDPALRGDLNALAEHFVQLGTLKTVFIENLVPWVSFVRPWNAGHAAIADFLITRGVAAAVSTNYDALIERCAWSYGADFRAALNGPDASARSVNSSPLLKIHGCEHLSREETIWARSQLGDAPQVQRLATCAEWLRVNIAQKDLLILGFWTDWDYLNESIAAALGGVTSATITVIDPESAAELERRAPQLWELCNAPGVIFRHERESAADVLDTLRRAFSVNYLRQVLAEGRGHFELMTGAECDPLWCSIALDESEALYSWRRDAEGVSRGPATRKSPENSEVLGYFHLLLRRAGGQETALGYNLNGKTVRVVNGSGKFLSSMRSQFVEPPSLMESDVTVAVGAVDIGAPADFMRPGRPGHVFRTAPSSEWQVMDKAIEDLGL